MKNSNSENFLKPYPNLSALVHKNSWQIPRFIVDELAWFSIKPIVYRSYKESDGSTTLSLTKTEMFSFVFPLSSERSPLTPLTSLTTTTTLDILAALIDVSPTYQNNIIKKSQPRDVGKSIMDGEDDYFISSTEPLNFTSVYALCYSCESNGRHKVKDFKVWHLFRNIRTCLFDDRGPLALCYFLAKREKNFDYHTFSNSMVSTLNTLLNHPECPVMIKKMIAKDLISVLSNSELAPELRFCAAHLIEQCDFFCTSLDSHTKLSDPNRSQREEKEKTEVRSRVISKTFEQFFPHAQKHEFLTQYRDSMTIEARDFKDKAVMWYDKKICEMHEILHVVQKDNQPKSHVGLPQYTKLLALTLPLITIELSTKRVVKERQEIKTQRILNNFSLHTVLDSLSPFLAPHAQLFSPDFQQEIIQCLTRISHSELYKKALKAEETPDDTIAKTVEKHLLASELNAITSLDFIENASFQNGASNKKTHKI